MLVYTRLLPLGSVAYPRWPETRRNFGGRLPRSVGIGSRGQILSIGCRFDRLVGSSLTSVPEP